MNILNILNLYTLCPINIKIERISAFRGGLDKGYYGNRNTKPIKIDGYLSRKEGSGKIEYRIRRCLVPLNDLHFPKFVRETRQQ